MGAGIWWGWLWCRCWAEFVVWGLGLWCCDRWVGWVWLWWVGCVCCGLRGVAFAVLELSCGGRKLLT